MQRPSSKQWSGISPETSVRCSDDHFSDEKPDPCEDSMTDKPEKKRMGRPVIEINASQVEKLACRWMTKDAIADFLGVHRSTLHERMKVDPELEAAWYRGRASLQVQSMDWLITSAKSGSVRAQIFLA